MRYFRYGFCYCGFYLSQHKIVFALYDSAEIQSWNAPPQAPDAIEADLKATKTDHVSCTGRPQFHKTENEHVIAHFPIMNKTSMMAVCSAGVSYDPIDDRPGVTIVAHCNARRSNRISSNNAISTNRLERKWHFADSCMIGETVRSSKYSWLVFYLICIDDFRTLCLLYNAMLTLYSPLLLWQCVGDFCRTEISQQFCRAWCPGQSRLRE